MRKLTRTAVLKFCPLACAATVASALLAGCVHFQSQPLSPSTTAEAFEKRSLADAGLKKFLERNLNRDLPEWPLKAWDFETLTLVAFYYHPALDVARAQWSVAQAGVRTAGGRPNPTVSLVPGYSFNAPEGTSPWLPLVNFDVPLETAHKRGHRIAHARQLSEAARLSIASAAWQVRASLRASLLDFAAARRRVVLLQAQLEVQRQIVRLFEQRLAAGTVAAIELTPSRTAFIKTQTDLAEARRQAAEGRARVAEALGVSLKAIEDVELDFDLGLPADDGKELLAAEVRRQALLGRPDILAALAEYAASQTALQLEIAKQYPDVHLGNGYQFDQGEHKWSLGLTAELPILNRNQGTIAEAQAKRAEAAARFVALQAKVVAEIDRALANRAAAQDQLRRSEALLQVQRRQAQAVEAMFNAGSADQLELRSAQLEARVAESAHLDALSKAHQTLGQLEEALQRPFDALKELERGRQAHIAEEKP